MASSPEKKLDEPTKALDTLAPVSAPSNVDIYMKPTTGDFWHTPLDDQETSWFHQKLPVEVRERIFCIAITTGRERRSQVLCDWSKPWQPSQNDAYDRLYLIGEQYSRHESENPICTNMLLACKSWHDEITPLLYRNVHLTLHNDVKPEIALFRTHPQYLSLLRTLFIDFKCIPSTRRSGEGHQGPVLGSVAERLQELLIFCALAET